MSNGKLSGFVYFSFGMKKETLSSIIPHLQDNHNLYVSPKTLKTKLQEWGLIKKMNPQDAEDLLAAQARLDVPGQSGFLLLRGRVEHIKRVHDYQRRRAGVPTHQSTISRTTANSTSSQVVILSCHPRLRPEPALALLSRFESLLREMQLLLHAGKQASMCIPGHTILHWKTSTTKSETLERSLDYSIREGARAHREGDSFWAGLCWQSALLTLEDLIGEPDLNVWICFIRCCVRLARYQAKEVAELFLWKLRWLRDKLPFSALHRAFIYALADVSLSDLVDGCLFALEANLRNVELLWPLERDCHIEYQLQLGEERLYQGRDTTRNTSQVADFRSLIDRVSEKNTWIQRSQISACVLLSDYAKAEMIVHSYIFQLENQGLSYVDKQGNTLSTLLSNWYLILGNIQYRKFDHTHSRASYLKCLQFHRDAGGIQTANTLQRMQISRILSLLDWLNTVLPLSPEATAFNLSSGTYKQNLQTELNTYVQHKVDLPFSQQLNPTLNSPPNVGVGRKKTPPLNKTVRPLCYDYTMEAHEARPIFYTVDGTANGAPAPGPRRFSPPDTWV